MNIRPLTGFMFVTRDPDLRTYTSKDGEITLIMPDIERIRTMSGYVHLHNASAEWNSRPLTNKHILFSKYSEREFKLGSRLFCTVDERDVLAVFTRSSTMDKSVFLEQIYARLGEVEGNELTGNDLTQIAEDVSSWAEDELQLEEGDEDEEPESPSEEPNSEKLADPVTDEAQSRR